MLTYDRHIVNLDLDTFFVSVERLRNPKFINKPLLIGGNKERGIVAASSIETKKYGIYNGMAMRDALRLCKHAIIVKSDFEAYSRYSNIVTEIIKNEVPLFERASINEFYVDLTGMDKFFGCKKFTDELKDKVYKESGLPSSYGLASNKTVSRVATNQVKPNGQLEIPFGNEKSFLAPLSVTKIPGLGKETGLKLLKMGVEKIETLSNIPVEQLISLLGTPGAEIWRKANGIDNAPVLPYTEERSISTEHTFQKDTIDLRLLHAELTRLTEKLAFELRSQNRLTGCVVFKLRYTDFTTYTFQKSIPYTNSDHILISTAKELLTKGFQRRLLIRLIGVRFSSLIPGNYQISLFDDTEEMIKLYQAIDSVKNRYGENKVIRAVGHLSNVVEPSKLLKRAKINL